MQSADFITLIRAASDPWTFFCEHIYTQDPACGVRAFPQYEFLRELTQAAERERFLLVPKSRQMMVTWTMTALFLWRALFKGPGVYLFLSRNERCAQELLERTRFLIEHLPEFMQPKLSIASREEIAFGPLGSRILSLPASANGPRMYCPSGVFWDEMAFTPYDEDIWAALKPALDSGGCFVGVSSSNGANNLFARFVQTNSPPLAGGIGGAIKSPDSSLIPPPSSLFCVHRIHYTQHPERTTEDWKKIAAAGLSENRWRQEYEISFESQDDLVYSEFDPAVHVLKEDWQVNRDWEIFRAVDFGYHHPFVLWLQVSPEGDVVVFDEWAGEDRTTGEMLLSIVSTDLRHGIRESNVKWTACDPAGAAVPDAGISPVDVLRRGGLKLRYRASHIAPGVERVKSALCDAAGKVSLRISPRCKNLIADLSRYRWAADRDEPLKDGLCDHSLDALRYFFVNLDSASEDMDFAPRLAGMRR
ncbi:hypothetical protein EHM69_04265 [candidate division KSB1 bacterium]|nr:MAG: hypothetical protein EHM69_04265 [candidate division KSB1 bacterium]